ncbi:MAG: hypothetical protein J6C93_06615 [Clostridia bacterium]|nr:hypothetical protein [Clostridia bacterium]
MSCCNPCCNVENGGFFRCLRNLFQTEYNQNNGCRCCHHCCTTAQTYPIYQTGATACAQNNRCSSYDWSNVTCCGQYDAYYARQYALDGGRCGICGCSSLYGRGQNG